MKRILLALSLIALSLAGSAMAQNAAPAVAPAAPPAHNNIEEQDKINKSQNEIQDTANTINKSCGSNVSIVIDYPSFANDDWSAHSPIGWCLQAANGIAARCSNSSAFKQAVATKLQTLACAKSKTGLAAASLDGGTAYLVYDWFSKNLEQTLVDYLNKNL